MARAEPELRPCGIAPDLRFNPSRSLPFSSESAERTRRTQYFDSSHPTIFQHYRQIENCQRQSGHIGPDESASV